MLDRAHPLRWIAGRRDTHSSPDLFDRRRVASFSTVAPIREALHLEVVSVRSRSARWPRPHEYARVERARVVPLADLPVARSLGHPVASDRIARARDRLNESRERDARSLRIHTGSCAHTRTRTRTR